MGLFDEFAQQIAGAVQALTEGNTPRLARGLLDMLQERGGLDGLVRTFREQHLEELIASWISTGPNRPITTEQLARVLDPEQLGELSRRAGIAMTRLPEALAALLPAMVDRLTPDGEIPDPYRLLRHALTVLRGETRS